MKGEKDKISIKINKTLKTEHEILYNPTNSCFTLL